LNGPVNGVAAFNAANASTTQKYGYKVKFDELSKQESTLGSFASTKTDIKDKSEQTTDSRDENVVLFVANPQFRYTRQLIRARPRLFNIDSRKDAKDIAESMAS